MKLGRFGLRASCTVLLMLAGCRNEPKIAEPTPAASVAPKSAATAKAQAEASVVPDEELARELEQRGKSCEPAGGEGRVRCAGGSNWAMVGDFLEKRRDRAASVGTMARMLESEHVGVRGLTAAVLTGAFGTLWGRDAAPGTVAPEAATMLLKNAVALPPAQASKVLPAAVNASMLSGQGAALLAELAKPERASLRGVAYPHLMTFGRLSAFDEIRRAVGSRDQLLALAALDAPMNMERWTDAEEETICSWAESLQADPRTSLKPKVNLILGNCSGARLDALLTRAEAQANTAQLDMDFQQALVAMCNRVRRPTLRATAQQCERARAVFHKTAQASQASPKDRAHAINWIARLWPDAQSKALLEQLQRQQDSQLAREASEGLKWIAAAGSQEPTVAAQAAR